MNKFLNSIETALEGAKYHEDHAFESAYVSQQNIDEQSYKKVTYHLRAYFWELWSVWDYILQNANVQTLNLREVNTSLVEELLKKSPTYKHLPLLQSIRVSDQRKRLARLRHSAHKWILDADMVEYDGDEVTVISLNMQDGKVPGRVDVDRNDYSWMVETVTTLKNARFFE